MSAPAKSSHSRNASHASVASSSAEKDDGSQVTFAAFSPSSSHSPLDTRPHRSTILIQQKSPLLIATPPQITRALAYSYPFIRPLNKLVGLLSWTSDDPWESFLLVAAFWAITLYGDVVIRWVGPLSVIIMLMFAMYVRRYSLLSSTEWTGEKRKTTQKGGDLQDNATQHKSLEDVVENLRLFTSRCNILLDPFLKLTDFLSTQTTATSATTRPALTAMFIRIFLVTPLWMALTLPPLYIVTTKRVVLAIGTTVLTWHSQPARVTRTIFWRSKLFRRLCTILTGLDLSDPFDTPKQQFASRFNKTPHDIAAALAAKRGSDSPGIQFTFTLYENQRRWLGIGWTSSLLAYERSPWTDEHMNATPSTDKFELPEVTGGHARWEWVQGSEWHIIGKDGEIVVETKESDSDGGWIYYDNKVI
jgi:Integral peroxisomal membrane peroxin